MKRVSLLFVSLLLVVGMMGCGAKEEGAASSVVESGAVVASQEKAESSGASVGAGAEAQGKVDGAQEVLASVASGEEVGKAVTDGAESKGENGAEAAAEQEAVVYEGIDMESTLPGKDWIKTFKGIIDVPKFVVFNNETNKKVIVEQGQEVEFLPGDCLYIFDPGTHTLGAINGEFVMALEKTIFGYCEVIFIEGCTIITDTITVDMYLGKERLEDLTCTIVVPE